eukprot:3702982-Rhodomonas_salina.2
MGLALNASGHVGLDTWVWARGFGHVGLDTWVWARGFGPLRLDRKETRTCRCCFAITETRASPRVTRS